MIAQLIYRVGRLFILRNMKTFETFLQLHYNETPLLIGNVWDVVSAKAFERNGFRAVATSSAGVAHTWGYEDGEKMPFDLLLKVVERIMRNINIPLSVDMEGGYSRDTSKIIQNIEKLHELGVVGVNIEDSVKGEKLYMQPVDDFQKIISSISNHLEQKNIKIFLNARTDTFLHKLPSPITETIKRIKAYENAGANGIFVPLISDKDEIREVVEATKLPLNVFSAPTLPGFKELSALGVRRISMGRAVHIVLTRSLEKIIETVTEDQSFKSLY
jgi:2-methylisocitrate lyase-like PEP mutase family enzyme